MKWGKEQNVHVEKEETKKANQLKVLIVEDNDFNIVPIKTTLSRNQIGFEIAKNGVMAVERYQRSIREGFIYGVVLMDLEMPLMDGYEATIEIRKVEKAQSKHSTYICGLSAYRDKGLFAIFAY